MVRRGHLGLLGVGGSGSGEGGDGGRGGGVGRRVGERGCLVWSDVQQGCLPDLRWPVEHAAVLCVFGEEVLEVVVELWWGSRGHG